MKEEFLNVELLLDEQFKNLAIWELPFQSIVTALLHGAAELDNKGSKDTAMDFVGRLSYIYKNIILNAKKAPVTNSSESVLLITEKYSDDLNFIVAYAHLCLLMPQIRKDTLAVEKLDDKKYKLNYPSESVREAELIDKLYSVASLEVIISFPKEAELRKHIAKKIDNKLSTFDDVDAYWVEQLFQHHRSYFMAIKVLPSATLSKAIGVTYDDYYNFCAALRSFSDYFIFQSNELRARIISYEETEETEWLANEYIEFSVGCYDYKFIGFFLGVSRLSKPIFDKIFEYYLIVYSNTTSEKYVTKSFCGDGYFPPITFIDNSILFSPFAVRYTLNLNNILYSINKNEPEIFNNTISKQLEPTITRQMQYVFSHIKDIEIVPNVNYTGSEIDLMVLSEKEKCCICIQTKTTIAPDSSRTVGRVQDRVIEAQKQIDYFQSIGTDKQLELVNATFKKELTDVKIINLIIVRSAAGSDKAWAINKKYKILNYSLLANLICRKVTDGNHLIADIEKEIEQVQNDLIKASNWTLQEEVLKIGDYEITFYNINYDDEDLITLNFRNAKLFKNYQESLEP